MQASKILLKISIIKLSHRVGSRPLRSCGSHLPLQTQPSCWLQALHWGCLTSTDKCLGQAREGWRSFDRVLIVLKAAVHCDFVTGVVRSSVPRHSGLWHAARSAALFGDDGALAHALAPTHDEIMLKSKLFMRNRTTNGAALFLLGVLYCWWY